MDDDFELVEVERLLDEIVGAKCDGTLDVVDLGIGGDHDGGTDVTGGLELLEDVYAIHVAEADVEQDEIGRFVVRHAKYRQRRFRLRRRDSPIPRTSGEGTSVRGVRRRQ